VAVFALVVAVRYFRFQLGAEGPAAGKSPLANTTTSNSPLGMNYIISVEKCSSWEEIA